MNFTILSDFLQNPATESKSRRMLSKSLGLTSKRHDMCKISNYQWIWMNLTWVLPCECSHFSSPRRALGTFCGSSSSNNKKKKQRKKRTPTSKKHLLDICVTTCKLCLCICKRSFFNIKIDCDKIGENSGSKDISYTPFYGTGGRDPGNKWIVSIRLVNQNCIPCRILLLLRSRVPFHASFQRFEGHFEGVFLFYFRWSFEENEEIDQVHWQLKILMLLTLVDQ